LSLLANTAPGKKDGVLVRVPLSREGLANYIGVARETLSRKLSLLESEGIIHTVGKKAILIRDLAQLGEAETQL
jgi:CRP/FNR family transcriptional regulator